MSYEKTLDKVKSGLDKYDNYSKEEEKPIEKIRKHSENKENRENREVVKEVEREEDLTQKEKIIKFIKEYVLFYLLILMILLSIQPDFILEKTEVKKNNLIYTTHSIDWIKTLMYSTIFYVPYFIWMISDKSKLKKIIGIK